MPLKTRRIVRSVFPFPFYYADYWVYKQPAYVRLLDGGSSDNLGAYRLIVDGFKDVIISDHAQDIDGRMADVCVLRNELKIRHGLHLHIPGLEGWPYPCMSVANRSMEENRRVRNLFDHVPKYKREDEYYYPIHAWPYPFLVGCVTSSSEADACLNNNADFQHIWIIKPAMDFAYYHNNQVNQVDGLVKSCGNEDYFLPCETSGFLINNFTITNSYGFPTFPQNKTVNMTINSSSTLYGAYRDLAESYTSKVLSTLKRIKQSPSLFSELLKVQKENPIINSINDKEIFMRHGSDVSYKKWKLKHRDKARAAFSELIFN